MKTVNMFFYFESLKIYFKFIWIIYLFFILLFYFWASIKHNLIFYL
jgi:hypothetical protein